MAFTVILLLAFAVAVGIATFIEDAYDTAAAKILVFNAEWFEMLLFVLAINLLGGMLKYNVFSLKKLSQLTFHLSFVLILLGAAITRFEGFEGQMMIQEGTQSNIMYSAEPYLQFIVGDADGAPKAYRKQHWMSEGTPSHNAFDYDLEIPGKPILNVKYIDFIKDAELRFAPGNGEGNEMIVLQVPRPGGGGMDTVILNSGAQRDLGGLIVSFNNSLRTDAVKFITQENGNVVVSSPYDIVKLDQSKLKDLPKGTPPMSVADTVVRDSVQDLQFRAVHMVNGVSFVYKSHFDDAKLVWRKARKEGAGTDVLIAEFNYNKQSQEIAIQGGANQLTTYYDVPFEDLLVRAGYGPKEIALPFYVYNKDFRLKKYPGSGAASSFECDVVINDSQREVKKEANIFMNHVLDYRGYRFFQSSYSWSDPMAQMRNEDPDITILSVNHDMPGTIVSYIGYILMAFGFVWTLFNKNSRFTTLRKTLRKLKNKRAAAMVAMLLSIPAFGQGIESSLPEGLVNEAETVFIQEFKGRVSPLQTHAIDVMYKLKKKRSHGDLSATEAYLSMIAEPEKWYTEKVIYIKEEAVRDLIGIDGKYASIFDFLDKDAIEKDSSIVTRLDITRAQQRSHMIKDADKSIFDKGIIKAFDTYQFFLEVLQGRRFKVFPSEFTTNHYWITYAELKYGEYKQEDAREMAEIMLDIVTGIQNKDYEKATKGVFSLKAFQKAKDPDILPSDTAVSLEVMYNDLQIFFLLLMIYTTLGLLLLPILMTDLFYPELGLHRKIGRVFFWLLVVCTATHGFGLGLRWYITDHAPWSNGYEALVFIAFATMLAGIIFYKSSRFTIAATAILAGLILGVAHGASTDPELTNLVPVLKSVWLVIHVAIITSSYGFLGLGAILALINILLYALRGTRRKSRINDSMSEITATMELTMTIGLYMAAIGTFLGGVWASESWGRYWGWDPKETWALIIVLTYAILMHFRFIPGMKGKLTFNVAALWAYSTVIMTYFGVNYYLTNGLHSYAQGEKSFLPNWAIITCVVLLVLCIVAAIQNKRYKSTVQKS